MLDCVCFFFNSAGLYWIDRCVAYRDGAHNTASPVLRWMIGSSLGQFRSTRSQFQAWFAFHSRIEEGAESPRLKRWITGPPFRLIVIPSCSGLSRNSWRCTSCSQMVSAAVNVVCGCGHFTVRIDLWGAVTRADSIPWTAEALSPALVFLADFF